MARILIVEDEANILKLVSVNLEARGHEVIGAEDGREGLARLRDALPEVLLLDIKLPDMSGWELLKIISADPTYPQIPVIVITASLNSANQDYRLYKNLRKVLVKPLSVQELTREVKGALN
ncbi:MAG TPA: response regulator [Anaerolineales bacterium]|nr:response regulator [Anaerolineales bacterium]